MAEDNQNSPTSGQPSTNGNGTEQPASATDTGATTQPASRQGDSDQGTVAGENQPAADTTDLG